MHRASETQIIAASQGCEAGVAVADGEIAGKATQVHAGTRAGSVCQTAGKPGEGWGRGGWLVLAGWRSWAGRGRAVALLFVGLLCFC